MCITTKREVRVVSERVIAKVQTQIRCYICGEKVDATNPFKFRLYKTPSGKIRWICYKCDQ